jgi:hypothetical protein
MENPETDPSAGLPDADDAAPPGEASRDEDTSGGPLSSGAGEGAGHGAGDAPDVDVPGGAGEGV